jgi:hypothetical protein
MEKKQICEADRSKPYAKGEYNKFDDQKINKRF